MAFTGNYTCNTFKLGLASADFDFATGTTDVFKIALYTNAATLDASTSAYTTDGEVVETGYTAGGEILTPSVSISDGVWTLVLTGHQPLRFRFSSLPIPTVRL